MDGRRLRSQALTAIAAAGFAAGGTARITQAGTCSPEWSSNFAVNGLQPVGKIFAATIWDDGSGPALYVGGQFVRAGGNTAVSVAKLTASGFVPLGQGVSQLSGGPAGTNPGRVHSLAGFDPDGPGGPLPNRLYVGGKFIRAVNTNGTGVSAPSGLVAWTGTAWATVPTPGISDTVYALKVFDDGTGSKLYAGGGNDTSEGHLGKITRFNGTSWTTVLNTNGVNDLNYSVRTFALHDEDGDGGNPPQLFACGLFTAPVRRIIGTTMENIDPNNTIPREPYTIESFDADGAGPNPPRLYAGGGNFLAVWNGTAWVEIIDQNQVPNVYALRSLDLGDGPRLYVGGSLNITPPIGQDPADYKGVVAFDGTNFSSLDGGIAGTVHTTLSTTLRGEDTLFIGGEEIIQTGGIISYNMGFWNGDEWLDQYDHPANGVILGDRLTLLDVDAGGPGRELLSLATSNGNPAGQFINAEDSPRLVQWNGSSWSDPGFSPPGELGFDVLYTIYDDGSGPALFATGVSENTYRLYKFSGGTWTQVAGILGTGNIWTMTVHDVDGPGGSERPWLILGGRISTAGDVNFPGVVAWDGTNWRQLGAGFPVDEFLLIGVYTLEAFNGQLYAAGVFPDLIASQPFTFTNIARFDGTTWHHAASTGSTTIDSISVLRSLDLGGGESLYIGGSFTSIEGAPCSNIARYDGDQFHDLGGGVGGGLGVKDVARFDDGTGPALYACGDFTNAGGVSVQDIARFDGTAWSALAGGLTQPNSATATSMQIFDDDANGPIPSALYVTGRFEKADGKYSLNIARWSGCVQACAADFNGVNGVTVQDIFDFLTAWLAGNASADFNGVNGVTVQDIFDFLTAWLTGC